MAETYVANPTHGVERGQPRVNFSRAFHERLPGYTPTPLLDASALAAELGVRRLWIKDESTRMDLPSYELLGAAWAIYRAAMTRLGRRPKHWSTLDELVPQLDDLRPARVVAVSDGSFGLAVAHGAQLLGFEATIFVPESTGPGGLAALNTVGADVVAAGATYDDALAAASVETTPSDIVIADSSWEGFTDVPLWVTEGYTTVFEEVADELEARGADVPGVVLLPLGSAALAASAAAYLRTEQFASDLKLIGVEPEGAACFGESVASGSRVTCPDPASSVLGSLARGLPSKEAFDPVIRAFDGFVAISDARAVAAAETLDRHGVIATPAGAASLAGLELLVERDDLTVAGLDALIVVTEGPLR